MVFEAVIKIALEISTEGREGRSIGTAFILGDSENVLAKSRQLIMNPFQGYKKEERLITDPDISDNIKEFAQLDGAFVITGDGVVEAAGRYITYRYRNGKTAKRSWHAPLFSSSHNPEDRFNRSGNFTKRRCNKGIQAG